MNDPLEENTKNLFLCDRITLFGSMLNDSFVLDVEDNYRILHGARGSAGSYMAP